MLNKKCYVTGAIKIESIFLGDKVTLQIKLYEAIVRVMNQGKRLLSNDYRRKRISGGELTTTTATTHVHQPQPVNIQEQNMEEKYFGARLLYNKMTIIFADKIKHASILSKVSNHFCYIFINAIFSQNIINFNAWG